MSYKYHLCMVVGGKASEYAFEEEVDRDRSINIWRTMRDTYQYLHISLWETEVSTGIKRMVRTG